MRSGQATMFLAWCVLSFLSAAFGETSMESPKFCSKTSVGDLCSNPGCDGSTEEPCYHGDCSNSGQCICLPCWRGPSCSDPGNDHAPIFEQTFYEVYISPDESTYEYPFLYVRATDKDEETCGVHCPCAQVSYSLDNANTSTFMIDPITGGIILARGAKLAPNSMHQLRVYAVNEGGFQHQATVPVRVHVWVSDSFAIDSGQSVKLRKLQAAAEIQSMQENGTLDISFLPSASDIAIGSLSVGTRVNCELTINIPESILVPDINVEIFTEDDNSTLSVLCPPTITVGSEVDITASTAATMSYYQQDANPFLYDTASFNFGNVTNLNTSTNVQDSKIVIMFSITLKEDKALAADERYWVSAGVEYNDEIKLWIGQIGFLIDQEPQYAPDTNVSVDGPSEYYKGEVEVFNLDVNVYRSVANLTVKAAAGSSVQPYLMICELQLCNTGTGFCLDASKDLATFTLDEVSKMAFQSTFNFGNIVNGGVANSTSDSWISMDVVTYLASDATDETSYELSVLADDGLKESTSSAAFTSKASRTYITPGRVIAMNASLLNSDGNLAPMQTAKLRVAIEVPASTSILPVTVRLQISPTKKVEICNVRINHIGSDISCLEQRREDIEKAVVYTSGVDVTIDLGAVANTGGEKTANGWHNSIGVDFVLKSSAIDLAENNVVYTASVTVTYASLTLADASVTVTTITVPGSITYPAVPESAPNPTVSSVFDLLNPNRSAEVAPGEYILLVIRHIIRPNTQYRYIANALVNTTDMTIVDMRVTKMGSNLVCGTWSDPKATYTNFLGGATRDMAEIDMQFVYNLGRSTTPTLDEDGFEIQLVVQVTEGASDTDIPTAVSLLVGATRLWVAEASITAKASVATEPSLPTNNTLAPAPGYSTLVAANSQILVLHTLVIPADTSSKYTVNYTTTRPWLEITNINVTTVGERLLCTQDRVFSPIYGLSSSGSFAYLDLDYVCSIPVANDTDENNQLVIELTVKTMNSSDVQLGASAVLAANLEVSNALEASLDERKSNLFSVGLPKSTFKLCCSESAYLMRPGETERCNVTLTMLDDALSFKLELEIPFNDTAAMTLSNVEVGSCGYNLQCVTPEVVLRSSGNTSQNNLAVVDFGTIKTKAPSVVDGNDVVVYIDVQMSDGSQNTNGSHHTLEAGIGVNGGLVIWVAYYKLGVLRDGTERPNLNVSYSHNGSSTYSLGESVWYSVDLTHRIDSNAEAVNVKGHIFLPPYIQFESMVPNYELSGKQPVIGQSDDSTGFYFTIPRLFFSDHVAFSIETTIKTNYRYKLTKNWKGTTPIEVVYYMQNYGTHYTDGQYFSEPMDYVTYDFTVPYPDIPGPNPPPPCLSPQPLGMQDRTIQNCQITASFAPDPAASAYHARLDGASGWKTLARAGPFLYDRWIKVDLGKRSAVTGVKTQGGKGDADGDLGQFEVLYSLDDTLYKTATPSNNQAFDHQKDSPADHNTKVSHSFMTPVEARYVIVNLTAYDFNRVAKWYNAMRLEIMGCPIDLTMASDVCPTPSPSLLNSYERGFLVDQDSDTLFVCDTITHGLSGIRKELQASVYAFLWKKPDMQCFMMIYAEKQWTGLDPRVRNIIGYLPSTERLYGIMSNAPDSYAASDKPYSDWFLISTEDYNTAAASPGFVHKVNVPFVSTAGFSYTSPDNYNGMTYAINDWKATMSGIYKGSEKVLDWNECCQPSCAANGGLEGCI